MTFGELALFSLLPLSMMAFVIYEFLKKEQKRPKINIEVSNKYKEMAYQLIVRNERLTAQRNKHNLFLAIKGICAIIAVISIILMRTTNIMLLIIIPIAAIIAIIILQFCEKGNAIFDDVIPSVIAAGFNELGYNHKSGIDRLTYVEAGFEGFDKYRSDDLIKGKVCNCDFEMSEVHTEREYRDKDGHTHYVTVFHGTFSKVNLNKNIGGFINIVNNKIKLFNRDRYVTIDNEAFEKIYDVFTDDKVKALRLLTPDVTTNMIDLYNETGIYCEVKVYFNTIYIRLFTGALFNFSFSNANKEALMVGKSLAVIDSILKIMENFIKVVKEFDV